MNSQMHTLLTTHGAGKYFHHFKKIINFDGSDYDSINYLVEYLCGKSISGYKPSFQGYMNFGSENEIMFSKIIPDQSSSSAQIISRNKGRVQINITGDTFSGYIFTIVKNNKVDTVFEEVTNATYELSPEDEIKAKNLPNLTPTFLTDLLYLSLFGEKMISNTADKMQLAFISEHSSDVTKYLFNNPLKDIDTKSLSSYESIFYNQFYNIYESVYSSLTRHLVKNTLPPPPPLMAPHRQVALGAQLLS